MPEPKAIKGVLPSEVIERRIYIVRKHKVMLDSDLASLYGVETFNLNKAVKRNLERFPADFMFQITFAEREAFEIPNWNIKPRQSGWP